MVITTPQRDTRIHVLLLIRSMHSHTDTVILTLAYSHYIYDTPPPSSLPTINSHTHSSTHPVSIGHSSDCLAPGKMCERAKTTTACLPQAQPRAFSWRPGCSPVLAQRRHIGVRRAWRLPWNQYSPASYTIPRGKSSARTSSGPA